MRELDNGSGGQLEAHRVSRKKPVFGSKLPAPGPFASISARMAELGWLPTQVVDGQLELSFRGIKPIQTSSVTKRLRNLSSDLQAPLPAYGSFTLLIGGVPSEVAIRLATGRRRHYRATIHASRFPRQLSGIR